MSEQPKHKKTRSNPKGAGRPSVMTDKVLQKLEHAFAYDMNDAEACLYAGIGVATLYEYQKDNVKFAERKRALKNTPALIAREEMVKALKTRKIKTLDKDGNLVEIEIPPNTKDLKWYLERKVKDEFSPKFILEHDGGIDINDTREVAQALQDIYKKIDATPNKDTGDSEDSE